MSSDLNHNVTQKARTLRIITLFLPLVTIAFTVPLIVIQFRPFPFVGVIPQIAATLLAIVELVPFPKFTGKRYQYRILLPIDDEQEHQHLRPKYQSRLIVILLDAVVAISILIICIVWWTTNPGRYNRSNGVLASYGTVSLLASFIIHIWLGLSSIVFILLDIEIRKSKHLSVCPHCEGSLVNIPRERNASVTKQPAAISHTPDDGKDTAPEHHST